MRIIDPKTGKRLDGLGSDEKKELKLKDPVQRGAEKELDMEESSPMDPPDAYDTKYDLSDELTGILLHLQEEHKEIVKELDAFDEALKSFKEGNYELTSEINAAFSRFFDYYDNQLLSHGHVEDKVLFPLLHEKLIESGEHSGDSKKMTSVDLMEDDHVKMIQLGTLVFNFLGLASRIGDAQSKMFILDTAFNNGRELVELIKLHIYREDNKLFPIAQKLIDAQVLEEMKGELVRF